MISDISLGDLVPKRWAVPRPRPQCQPLAPESRRGCDTDLRYCVRRGGFPKDFATFLIFSTKSIRAIGDRPLPIIGARSVIIYGDNQGIDLVGSCFKESLLLAGH